MKMRFVFIIARASNHGNSSKYNLITMYNQSVISIIVYFNNSSTLYFTLNR